jgi:hypothetical protein
MSDSSTELSEEGHRVFLKTIPDDAPTSLLRDICVALQMENARLEQELAAALTRAQRAEGELQRRAELALREQFPQKGRRRRA